ncbi:MAG: alpha/beta hydrolase family protein [Pseudomonadota bacterium]
MFLNYSSAVAKRPIKQRLLCSLGFALCLTSGPVLAESTSGAPTIPHEHFFANTLYTDVVISPDGTYYAVKADAGDRDQIIVIERENNSISSSFELGEYQRFSQIHWVNNERFIFQSRKRVGLWDEQELPPNLYAANADGSNRLELFAWGRSGFQLMSLMPDDPEYIMINKYHFADEGEAKAHRINVDDGRSFYLGDQPPEANELIADNDGNLRLSFAYKEEDDDDFGKGQLTIYYKKLGNDDWQELTLENYERGDNINMYGFSDDNRYAFFGSDMQSDVSEVYQFDTKELTVKQLTDDSVADVMSPVTGVNGNIIGFDFMPDKIKRIYTDNTDSSKLMKSLEAAFPGQHIRITSNAKDGQFAVVFVRSDNNPGAYYLFDTESLQASFIAAPNEKLDPEQLARITPIQFEARDGMELRGYLTLPKGAEKGDELPMIVNVHGGPHGPRDTWSFSAENQFFANRGYAVLQINFRGSGGYGKEFEEAGYREWGRAMQNDVTDGTLWAVEQGYADKERICIYGGSYGGYASMMGVAKEPDLYQCGVGYVGVYSLPLMYEDGDISERDSGRKYLRRVIGDDEQELKANSPVNLVKNIKADLFLVHGAKDVRVPISHYEQLTAALDEIGKPYQSLVKDDEGHGFQKEENKFDLYPRLINFFDQHIGD